MVAAAIARALLNNGDMDGFINVRAKLRPEQDELLALLDDRIQDDLNTRIVTLATRLELTVIAESSALMGLDIEVASELAVRAKEDESLLAPLLSLHSAAATRSIAESDLLLSESLRELTTLSDQVLRRRSLIGVRQRPRLAKLRGKLRRAEELAHGAGAGGTGEARSSRIFLAYAEKLERIGAGSGADLRRYARTASLVSFSVLTVTGLLFGLRGLTAAVYFGASLVISLAVGFGTSAVRFWPLVRAALGWHWKK